MAKLRRKWLEIAYMSDASCFDARNCLSTLKLTLPMLIAPSPFKMPQYGKIVAGCTHLK